METRRIYYEQPELVSVEASVLAVMPAGGHADIILDATPFYPEGGGQPGDLGLIAGFPVLATTEDGNTVLHRVDAAAEALAAAGVAPGARVRAESDAARRLDHTEQHTAQHLLSATILRMLGGPTRSFHLGERYCVIDVDLPAIDRDEAEAVSAEVTRAIRDGYAVRTHLCPPEDPASFPLRRAPPADAGVLRIVEIDGLDYTPCCGTHLPDTARIGLFRVMKTEKYKGMTRVYFLAGGRAYAEYGRLAAAARDLASLFGCAEEDVPRAAEACVSRAKALEAGLENAKDELSALRAERLVAAAPAGPVSATMDAGGFAEAARLARAVAALGRTALVASAADLKAAAAAPAGGTGLGAALKPVSASLGGKGGGGPVFFQAAFDDSAGLAAFMAAAARALS